MRSGHPNAHSAAVLLGVVAYTAAVAAIGKGAIKVDRATSDCPSTPVHYTGVGSGGLANIPWVRLGPTGHAYLFYYGPALADGRVNQSAGVVVYTGGGTANVSTKILWAPSRSSANAILRGVQLDGNGQFTQRLKASGRAFPSIVDLPTPGCWKLALRVGASQMTIIASAVDPPPAPVCDPTPLQSGPSPIAAMLPWIVTTPASAGITGTVFYKLPAGASRATIYPNKHAPDSGTTKILWKAPMRTAAKRLVVNARRLDAIGVMVPQTFMRAQDGYPGASFPSDIDVSSTGCWLLTVRSGTTAGIAVFDSVSSSG